MASYFSFAVRNVFRPPSERRAQLGSEHEQTIVGSPIVLVESRDQTSLRAQEPIADRIDAVGHVAFGVFPDGSPETIKPTIPQVARYPPLS